MYSSFWSPNIHSYSIYCLVCNCCDPPEYRPIENANIGSVGFNGATFLATFQGICYSEHIRKQTHYSLLRYMSFLRIKCDDDDDNDDENDDESDSSSIQEKIMSNFA